MSTDAEELRAVTRIVESLIARTDSGNTIKTRDIAYKRTLNTLNTLNTLSSYVHGGSGTMFVQFL